MNQGPTWRSPIFGSSKRLAAQAKSKKKLSKGVSRPTPHRAGSNPEEKENMKLEKSRPAKVCLVKGKCSTELIIYLAPWKRLPTSPYFII
jgi:hypothetical protein